MNEPHVIIDLERARFRMWILTLVGGLLLLAFSTKAADEKEQSEDAFLQELDHAAQWLLQSATPDVASDWSQKSFEATNKMSEKIAELKATEELLRKDPDHEKFDAVWPFMFSNEYYQTELDVRCKLVNNLGLQVLSSRIEGTSLPMIQDIDARLASLSATARIIEFEGPVAAYFSTKRRILELRTNLPVLQTFAFAPQRSANDSNPAVVATYLLHDWPLALRTVEDADRDFVILRDRLEARASSFHRLLAHESSDQEIRGEIESFRCGQVNG